MVHALESKVIKGNPRRERLLNYRKFEKGACFLFTFFAPRNNEFASHVTDDSLFYEIM